MEAAFELVEPSLLRGGQPAPVRPVCEHPHEYPTAGFAAPAQSAQSADV
jgi:hypothetical protein